MPPDLFVFLMWLPGNLNKPVACITFLLDNTGQ